MISNFKDIENEEKRRKEKRWFEALKKFNKAKECPRCGMVMRYAYGETFVCDSCGAEDLTDFGKVRDFLEINGPRSSTEIANATGVEIKTIDGFLREGRIEIPDGSEVYIKCQECGADIRYGRLCPNCALKHNKEEIKAIYNGATGEMPRFKKDSEGRMHTMERDKR